MVGGHLDNRVNRPTQNILPARGEGQIMRPSQSGERKLPAWLDMGGRSAIVTGGGTHLGLAFASTLAQLGAFVTIVGRRNDVLQRAVAEASAAGLRLTARAGDAADEEVMKSIVDETVETYGRLDVMVCNAGAAVTSAHTPNVPLADLEANLRSNVYTTVVCAQLAARHMIGQRSGSIVTIGSIQGHLGSDARRYSDGFKRSGLGYHIAKGAVVNMTRAMACELGQYGIRVNCLSPGHIPRSDMNEATREGLRAGYPLDRLGTPDDVRGAITLLATDAGSWMTGQNILVDGGWSAW